MRRCSGLAVVFTLLIFARTALGQEQPPVTTLQSLVEQLEKNNPEIRAARFRFEAATKRPSQVATLPEPKLTSCHEAAFTGCDSARAQANSGQCRRRSALFGARCQ